MPTLNLEEDLKLISSLPRDKFEQFYKFMNNMLFEVPGLNVDEIKDIKNGNTENFDYSPKLEKLANQSGFKFNDEDSFDFIQSVKASNVTDIANSGYFYKKISNCMDNVYIVEEDCGSEGEFINISNIDENYFKFNIKNMFVSTTNKYYDNYDEFVSDTKQYTNIKIRNPITCKNAHNRCFCRKCCGSLNAGDREFTTKNIGYLTVLSITEKATQDSLSTMNKGGKTSINSILEKNTGDFKDFDDLIKCIYEITQGIGYTGIQARWIYFTLLCKYVFDETKQIYKCTSLKTNSNYCNDKLGAYIFEHNEKNLIKLLNSDDFEIESLKSKNILGVYE